MNMHKKLEPMVAASLDATPELLPYLPELLADLWELGGSPAVIIDLLRPLKLPAAKTRVLDLGCGKGAIAIRLAQEFGFSVLGIDGFEPFIAEAREKAKEHGVEQLCRFRCGDLRDYLSPIELYDVVIYAAVGGALGNLKENVGKLRNCVRPGGYIIIDDAFLAEKTEPAPGYENYTTHRKTLPQLTAFGDSLLKEVITPEAEIRSANLRNTELIRRRAEKLARKYPEDAELIRSYVRKQEKETEILGREVACVVWLLQRN